MTQKGKAVLLRLYVAGEAPNSVRAIANLQAILRKYWKGDHELEIVNIIEEPSHALNDGVLVTPCLLRLSPPPVVTLIGDLSEEDKVLAVLGLKGNTP
ncbi:MAG: circadian clock protein KaiB [Chloroflexi bacterium]|nr:circadian clock protein KaiB [Chloroflexota bacterium]MBI3763917.1 circadian clock protein KaiB [Chloroflexota bacterium]